MKDSTTEEFALEKGMKFEILQPESGSFGDVDYDGKITSADSLIVLRASVSLAELSGNTKKLADVNGDGKIDSSDSLLILRHSVGFRDKGSLIVLNS